MTDYIRIHHRDGTVEERYDPTAAALLREMRRLDRQTVADCIEADDPQTAETLRSDNA